MSWKRIQVAAMVSVGLFLQMAAAADESADVCPRYKLRKSVSWTLDSPVRVFVDRPRAYEVYDGEDGDAEFVPLEVDTWITILASPEDPSTLRFDPERKTTSRAKKQGDTKQIVIQPAVVLEVSLCAPPQVVEKLDCDVGCRRLPR